MGETVLKRCSKCGVEKPATREFFYTSKKTSDGFKPVCVACRRLLSSEANALRRRPELSSSCVEGEKICTGCYLHLPATRRYFHANSKSRDGLASRCVECCRKSNAEKAKYRSERLKSLPLPKVKEDVLVKCSICGKEYPLTTEYFGMDKGKSLGFRKECRTCHSEKAKMYYQRVALDEDKRLKLLERRRIYRREKPEVHRRAGKKWREANPVKLRARSRFYAEQRRKVPGVITARDVRRQFDVQGGRCFYCDAQLGVGSQYLKWHLDHFIPVSRGGTHTPENIRIACQPCNNSKYNKMPWEWMPDRFSPPQ